jgi:hypothetical protein
MAQCDVHPQRNSRFLLQHHGQCYNMCSLYELDRLVRAVRTGDPGAYTYHTLPACGHGTSPTKEATWPSRITGIEDNDYAEESRCPQCCHLAHAPHACTTAFPDTRRVCSCKVGTASVPETPATGTPYSGTAATIEVAQQRVHRQVMAMTLQAALQQALYAAQDLYQQDRTAQHERWRDWAISWLREITQGSAH